MIVVAAPRPEENACPKAAFSSEARHSSSAVRVGFADARVVVALVDADRLLRVRRGLVDRRRHRPGGRVGLLADVDRARLEVHARDGRPPAVRASARRSAAHGLEPARAPEPVERAVEGVVERRRGADAGLAVERLHDERALAPLRLEVGPADDAVAPERTAARSSRSGARAPSCRPRSGGRTRARAARTAGPRGGCRTVTAGPPPTAPAGRGRAGRHDDGGAAVVDRDPLEHPVGDERVDDGADARGAAPEPPVLDDRRPR